MDDTTSAGGQASLAGDARLQDLWITARDATRTAVGRAGCSSMEAMPARDLRRASSSREVPAAYSYCRWCVWNVDIYIHIANIRLHNSACLLADCLCGRSRELDVCIHVWTLSLLYTHIVAICFFMSIYCQYSSTQLRLPAGIMLVWTKSRARCICTSVDIVPAVCTYCRYLIYTIVSDIHLF